MPIAGGMAPTGVAISEAPGSVTRPDIGPYAASQATADIPVDACAPRTAAERARPFAASGDVSVAGLSRLLNGTWVRRLTIDGVPIQTNSYLYVDIADGRGRRGKALMIDRINQGWDRSAAIPVAPAPSAGAATPAALQPATTGVLWSVSLRAAAGGPGARGVTLELAGDYRGTGADYPRGGFHFTESGTFYRAGNRYVTPRGWRAPPQASDTAATAPGSTVSKTATADAAYQVTIDAGTGPSTPATLTFANCHERVIDRYDKLSDDAPHVEGRSLTVAWSAALAAGLFRGVPAR